MIQLQNKPAFLTCSVHTHSTCCDGRNTLEEMAKAALQKGITVLGCSGHAFVPFDAECGMTPEETAAYLAEIRQLQQFFAGRLTILAGLEWDLCSPTDPAPFDYFIGSAHYVRGPRSGRYYGVDHTPEIFKELFLKEFDGDGLALCRAYYENVVRAAERRPTFLGHYDLVKKFNGCGQYFDEQSEEYLNIAASSMEAAIRYCSVLELNTGGVYRGYRRDFYPSPELLAHWKHLGGRVIITGDSHDTASLLFGFERAAEQLKVLGYESALILTDRGFEETAL